MLELLINGISVPLPKGTAITMEWNNMIKDPRTLPGSYSYPFTLARSEQVDTLLGRPYRVAGGGIFSSPEALIRFNGVTLPMGLLKIDASTERTHQVHILGSAYPVLTEANLCDIQMHQYNLGAGDLRSRTWHESVAGSAYINLIRDSITKQYPQEKFVAAPLRVKSPTMEGSAVGMSRNNFFGTFLNFFQEGDFVSQGSRDCSHFRCFPMPYVGYVLDAIMGGSLTNNAFTQSDLARLVMPTIYHKNSLLSANHDVVIDTTGASDNHYFRLNSFLPAYPAKEFMRNLLQIFGMGIYGNLEGYEFITYQDVIAGVGVVDWSKKMTDAYTVEPDPGKGYKYGYSSEEGTDEMAQDRTVQHMIDLETAELGEGELEEEDRQFFVKDTRQLMQIDRHDLSYQDDQGQTVNTTIRRYKTITSGLYGNQEAPDGVDMTSDIGPFPMTLAHYQGSTDLSPTSWSKVVDEQRRTWYVPFTESTLMEKIYTPSILFYRGMVSRGGDNPGVYPCVSATNKDINGNTLGELSLEWSGPSGLYEKFHKGFAGWVRKDKKRLKATFRLTIQDIRDLNMKHQVYVLGERWIVETLRVSLYSDRMGLAEAELLSV